IGSEEGGSLLEDHPRRLRLGVPAATGETGEPQRNHALRFRGEDGGRADRHPGIGPGGFLAGHATESSYGRQTTAPASPILLPLKKPLWPRASCTTPRDRLRFPRVLN